MAVSKKTTNTGKPKQTKKKTTVRKKKLGEKPDNIKTTIAAGDAVENVTKKTGIKKIVKKVFDKTGQDCGCNKRQEKLNQTGIRFSYNRKVIDCFTQDQYEWWKQYESSNRFKATILNDDEVEKFTEIGVQLFRTNYKNKLTKGCPKCVTDSIKYLRNDIQKVYEQYE